MSNEIVTEIIAFLLQDIPEGLVATLFVFSLAKIRYEARTIIYIALLIALTNLFVRLFLPIAFGVHTVIFIFAVVLYTRIFTKAQLSRIFLPVLVFIACIVAAESIYSMPLLKWTGLTYEECRTNPFLRAAFALPGEIIMLLLALGINMYRKKRRYYSG